MNQQSAQYPIQPMTLLLEFLPEQPEESDPAFIHAIGRDTVEALQHQGITVQPVYTGQQGGEFLVEIVTTLGQLATAAWDHRAVVEEVVNDTSALIGLSTFIMTVINHVKQSYEKRVGHAESAANPLKVTIELDGVSRSIETSGSMQAQAVITRLIQQAQAMQAPRSISTSKQLKIQPRIPKKRPRRKK